MIKLPLFYKLSQENLMFYLYNDINKYEIT